MLAKKTQQIKIHAIILFLLFFAIISGCSKNHHEKSQLAPNKSNINYGKIYGLALKGQIPKLLNTLGTIHPKTEKDSVIKTKFEKRFKFKTDRSNYLTKKDADIRQILKIFQQYWRKGLLHPDSNYDGMFKAKLLAFFRRANKRVSFTKENINDSTLAGVYKDYFDSKNLYSTDFGKTGKFYDLLVWKTMDPKTYTVSLIDDTVSVHVYFMKDFISLGWEEYATLGKHYPGGWTTDKAIYAVANAYDLQSENFKVHYLKHEGQHYSDMERFPKLSRNDLEYRAKLSEIYYRNNGLYEQIGYFINRAEYDPKRPHPFADYCLIKDMSQVLFDKNYVDDIKTWKTVSPKTIHQAAKQIYLENTKQLKRIGKDVKHYLGKYAKCGDYNL